MLKGTLSVATTGLEWPQIVLRAIEELTLFPDTNQCADPVEQFPPPHQIRVNLQINISVVPWALVATQETAVFPVLCIVLSEGRKKKEKKITWTHSKHITQFVFSILRNKEEENMPYCSFAPTSSN